MKKGSKGTKPAPKPAPVCGYCGSTEPASNLGYPELPAWYCPDCHGC
jgi:hypothetical protein